MLKLFGGFLVWMSYVSRTGCAIIPTGSYYLYHRFKRKNRFLFVQVIQNSDAEKANEILTEIKGGKEFEDYRTAEDNDSAEGKAQAIMAIGENDSVFDSAVYTLAKDMNVGDVDMVQAVTKDSDGNDVNTYYIVKRAEGTTGLVPYEDVKSVIDSTLKNYAESNYYTEQMEAWRAKANIVIDDDAVQAFDPAA